jgi:WD40 repeat protein
LKPKYDILLSTPDFIFNLRRYTTVDNRGNVTAFHIRRNRYSLLAREGHAGTAICMGNGEVLVAFADNVVRSYHSESGKLLATLKGHRSRITHLEVAPPFLTPTRLAQPRSDQQLHSFGSNLPPSVQSLFYNSTVRRSLTKHSCVRCGHLTEQMVVDQTQLCAMWSPDRTDGR